MALPGQQQGRRPADPPGAGGPGHEGHAHRSTRPLGMETHVGDMAVIVAQLTPDLGLGETAAAIAATRTGGTEP